jgi:hypothetical protein
LRTVIMATLRATRKYANLLAEPRVAWLNIPTWRSLSGLRTAPCWQSGWKNTIWCKDSKTLWNSP